MSDPQHCHGGAESLAMVAKLARLCECGHSAMMHDLGKRKGVTVRTACSVTERAIHCGCTLYSPSPSEESEHAAAT